MDQELLPGFGIFSLYFQFITPLKKKVVKTSGDAFLEEAKSNIEDDAQILELDLEYYKRLQMYWRVLYFIVPFLYLILVMISQ